ncbi:hypothetical protein RFI_05969 [Reticulomyxa filosa]|uniref:Uncharacterized protein n=1 Tax=Reticulomyxa filosa TaxID=46433 RepID=X6NZ43_RETFI|nr:hypothetical protein RFI_05969 [Reticulomyxa filosa]|eukprot:ETO31153.1 hypothetical protein RFI_05969 [Reticulomyxa filosa]
MTKSNKSVELAKERTNRNAPPLNPVPGNDARITAPSYQLNGINQRNTNKDVASTGPIPENQQQQMDIKKPPVTRVHHDHVKIPKDVIMAIQNRLNAIQATQTDLLMYQKQ